MFKGAVESAAKSATKTVPAVVNPSKYKVQASKLNRIAGVHSRASVKFNPEKYSGIELQMIDDRQYMPSKGIYDFWRQDLRTLKFHNEDLNFTVTKISCEEGEVDKVPARLIVHGVNGEVIVDGKNKKRSAILTELLELTKPEQVPAEEIPVITGDAHKGKK